MHIYAGVEVGMALVVTRGAEKELPAFAYDPLSCLMREPHAFTATTGTVLRRPMWIDFDTHHPLCIRFFLGQVIDFAFQLVGLFAVEPPGFASSLGFDHP